METIICAAIWFNDGEKHIHQPRNIETGFVVAGRRHHNCFATVGILSSGDEKLINVQGFLTNKDRFVGREEAATIALLAGQIPETKRQLFSEDIY